MHLLCVHFPDNGSVEYSVCVVLVHAVKGPRGRPPGERGERERRERGERREESPVN